MRVHEPLLLTGDPNQPLSVAYCEALIFTLNTLTNQQLAQLYEDTNLKLLSLGDKPDTQSFSEGLQLLRYKIEAVAARRFNREGAQPELTSILSL